MFRIFGHFVPVPTVALGVFETLLVSLALYLVTAPLGLEGAAAGLALDPVRLSIELSGVAMLCMMAVGLYSDEVFVDARAMAVKILLAFVMVAAALAAAAVLLSHRGDGHGGWSAWSLKAALVWTGSVVVSRVAVRQFSSTDLFRRRVVVVGTGVCAQRIAELVARRGNRCFLPKGFVHACGDPRLVRAVALDLDTINEEDALARYACSVGAGEIVVATDERRGMPTVQLLHCKLAGLKVVDYLSFWERETSKLDIEALQPGWLIYSDGFRQGPLVDAAKRVFDVAVSVVLLIVSLPVMLLTMAAIKLEGPGPLLYRQERVGRDGASIILLKFRSMRIDAECDGAPRWAAARDPRVTRVGAVIRKFRIDELPQLFNVLRGDMSFVGPRPERPFFVQQLSQSIPFYRERHAVKPGITGWAQVNHPYGASLDDAQQKLAFDLYYVKNRTIFLDFIILIQTVRVVLFGEGAR